MVRGWASAMLGTFVVTSAGCTLLLPYPDDTRETTPAQCGNGLDDDGDGRVDCDDPDCGVGCVEAPRLGCPSGWMRAPVQGAAPTTPATCEPALDVLDGCASEAPPGALVASPTPGAVLALLATIREPSPDPSAPPVEIWLEPGRHVLEQPDTSAPTPLTIGIHVAMHGLCREGAHAVLAPAPGSPSPIVGLAAVDLDHVEMELAADAATPRSVWRGGLALDHASVTSTGGTATLEGEAVGLTLSHARLDASVLLRASRLSATDASMGAMSTTGTSVTLTRVHVAGNLGLTGIGPLVGDAVFVSCGALSLESGASATLHHSLVATGPGGAALTAFGDPALRATVTLEDVALVEDTSCPPVPPVRLGFGPFSLTDLTLTRVLVADGVGLSLGVHAVARLDDVIVDASRVQVGLRAQGSGIEGARVRVVDARHAGVELVGDPGDTTRVAISGLDVARVRGTAGCPTPAAGVAVHAHRSAASGTALPVSLSVAGARVDDVAGCAFFVDRDVGAMLGDAHVSSSTTDVCSVDATRADLLAAGVTGDDGTVTSRVDVACAGSECVADGCGETSCHDGVDDDGDGQIDCADADCGAPQGCTLVPEDCRNLVDDDGDAAVDCADPDCALDPACATTGAEHDCTNGVDDDHDGAIDCADPDCALELACPPGERGACADGLDQDGDSAIDCADTDCVLDPACPESGHCADGLDNDGFGGADCADHAACGCAPSCGGVDACPERDLLSATGAVAAGTIDTTSCSVERLSCAPEATGGSITFAWQAPATASYTFDAADASGTGFDVVVAVRDGCGGPELACDHAGLPTFASHASVPLVAGQRVVIVLRSMGAAIGMHYALTIRTP